MIPNLDDLLVNLLFLTRQTLTASKIDFSKIEKCGIKIKASKCKVFRKEISYLGRLVSSEGYTADPKNILAVTSETNKKTENHFRTANFIGTCWLLEEIYPKLL